MSISSNVHFQNSVSQLRVCLDVFEETKSMNELQGELPEIELASMQKLYTLCNQYIKNFERLIARDLEI